jgi:hypothetical protein
VPYDLLGGYLQALEGKIRIVFSRRTFELDISSDIVYTNQRIKPQKSIWLSSYDQAIVGIRKVIGVQTAFANTQDAYLPFIGYFHGLIAKAIVFPSHKLSEIVNEYYYIGDDKEYCCKCPNGNTYKVLDYKASDNGGKFVACQYGTLNCSGAFVEGGPFNFVVCGAEGSTREDHAWKNSGTGAKAGGYCMCPNNGIYLAGAILAGDTADDYPGDEGEKLKCERGFKLDPPDDFKPAWNPSVGEHSYKSVVCQAAGSS